MKTKIMIIILIITLCTGCYNYKEINDLSIVSAFGIDKKGENYKVVAQTVNTQKSGTMESSGSSTSTFTTFTNVGPSLHEAYRNILNETGKKLYTNHTVILALNEEVAKEGISDIIDYFGRDYNFRKQVLVIITKDSTEEVLSIVTPVIPLNSDSIREIIKNNEKYIGETTTFTFEDLLKNHLSNKMDLIIPAFNIENNNKESENADSLKETNKESKLIFFSNAIFKENKLIGYLNTQNSIGYNMIMNNIQSALIDIECDDKGQRAVFELMNSKSNLKYIKNNEFKSVFKSNAVLTELNCNINIEDNKVLDNLEKKLNKKIKKIMKNSSESILKTYKTDLFGLREQIYEHNPKYYNKIKNYFYDDIITNIDFNIETNVIIESHGNIIRSANNE